MGLIIQYGSLSARGHGIPLLLTTVQSKESKLSTRDLFVEGFASIITIACGGSAGRIGPVVEIGSGIGDLIGHSTNFNTDTYRTILGCGAAAGISAIFHAPLGGIMFVIEILFREFKKINLGMIVISSITAKVVVSRFFGFEPLFRLPEFNINDIREYVLYALLGILVGFMSYLYIISLYKVNNIFEKYNNIPFFIKPALGGLIIGVIGYFYPVILGTGINVIQDIFNDKSILVSLVIIFTLKILSTAVTLGSGGSGGIFAPALLIGTSFGLFYGKIMNIVFPGIVSTPGSYGIVAMAAMISASIRAPLTGVLIIFEITGNYNLITPLFFTSIIARLVSSKLSPESIYSPLLFPHQFYKKD